MAKLTKRAIDAMTPDPLRKTFLWDGELRGFGVALASGGTKSYVIQYRIRSSGRERRLMIARYGVMTVDEARDEARRLLADVARGGDPAEDMAKGRKAATVAQLCQDYLDKAERGLILRRDGTPKKQSTLESDKGRIERHILPLIGRRAVKDVTTRDVRAFMEGVISGKTAADIKTKPRGRAIVRGGRTAAARVIGLLGAIFEYAVQEGMRPDNPVRGVHRPADIRRYMRLDADQYRALGQALDAAEQNGEPWQAVAAIRLIALTGCRRSEATTLVWLEVDEPGRTLRLGDTKTGASVRAIGTSALKTLASAKARVSGRYVFPAIHGMGSYQGLPKVWRRIVTDAGMPTLTPHGLRHAFASTAEDLGFSLPTIGALLGHAPRGVTAGYVAKADAALLDAAEKVSKHIHEAMTKPTRRGAMRKKGKAL